MPSCGHLYRCFMFPVIASFVLWLMLLAVRTRLFWWCTAPMLQASESRTHTATVELPGVPVPNASSRSKFGFDEVYVLHLQRRHDRYAHMMSVSEATNLSMRFWTGIDGSQNIPLVDHVR